MSGSYLLADNLGGKKVSNERFTEKRQLTTP